MSESRAAPVMVCERLSRSFPSGSGRIQVLDRCDLEVAKGEMLCVVGPSGVGKSTLLHLMGGLDTPDAGRVLLQGQDIVRLGRDARASLRNRQIGFVFQFHHLLREFTAAENVMLPFLIARQDPGRARRRALKILEELGLSRRAHHFPAELSGGERQRVALARAIAPEPVLVLADEPTGSLDPRTARSVFNLMLEIQREKGLSVVMVTHSAELAERCDRIAPLTPQGRFACHGAGGVVVESDTP